MAVNEEGAAADLQTKDDAAIAYQLQQNEIAERDARNQNTYTSSTTGPTIVGRPVYTEPRPYYQRYEYDDEETQPITSSCSSLSDREQYLLEVFSFGKGIACLAILDLCLLLFLSILDIYYLVLFWGPICGLLGASMYEVCYIYFYVVYYLLRIAGDTLMTIRGNWWTIISLVLDCIIFGYIILFITYLTDLNKSEKDLLRNPGPLLSRRPRQRVYYYY